MTDVYELLTLTRLDRGWLLGDRERGSSGLMFPLYRLHVKYFRYYPEGRLSTGRQLADITVNGTFEFSWNVGVSLADKVKYAAAFHNLLDSLNKIGGWYEGEQ